MRLILILILSFLSTSFTYASTQKNHCAYALLEESGAVGFNEYWAIDKNGKFNFDEKKKADDYSKDNFVRKGRQITFERKPFLGFLGFYRRAVVTLDNLGQVDQISIHSDTPAGESQNPEIKVIKFENKNGVCIPVSSQMQTAGGDAKEARDVNYNTKMCKDLRDYIDNNQRALECSCGDSDTNKSIQNILEKHYPFYSSQQNKKYGANKPLDKKIDIDDPNYAYIARLSTPLVSAVSELQKCEKNRGVRSALNDAGIWSSSGAGSSASPSSSPQKSATKTQ